MTFDVLASHLNPFCSHFIEASAGTGKTFAIEHIVVRLIIEGQENFLLEEILVVTFTKAATRELKYRIHKNLKKIHAELIQGESTIDYVRALQERGEAKLAIARIEQALLCYENAAIYTLHGFCFRLLKEFAVEAKVSPLIEDPDKISPQRALEEWIEKALKQEETLSSYSPVQIQRMMRAHLRSPRKWIATLAKYVWGSFQIEKSPSFDQLLSQFQKELVTFFPVEKDQVQSDLFSLVSSYTKIPKEGLDGLIALWAKILSEKECSYEEFDQLLASTPLLEKMIPEYKKKKNSPLDLHYPSLLDHLQKRFAPLLQKGKDPSLLVLNLVADLREKSRTSFQTGDLFVPDELLSKVQMALANPAFVKLVQKKFRAAIIDEFQDTDPLQWDIVKQLFSSSVLYLVGDPKQSIYAFRNADVYVYLDAKNQMGQGAIKSLTTNFRASPLLVQALNTLFSKVSPQWMALPLLQEELLEVATMQSGSCLSCLQGPAITWFHAREKKGRKFPSTSLMKTQVHPYIASEILKLHQEEKIPFHEMAILIKDRFQGQEVMESLKRSHIPCHLQRGGLITETEAYFSLREVLHAIYAIDRPSKVKTALATPLFGWSSSQLCQETSSVEFLKAKQELQVLREILLSQGFAPFFRALLALRSTDGELVRDLRRLFEIIVQEEEPQMNYLDYLEQLAFRAESDDPLLQTGSIEESGSIRIMTIHRSKGLEFTVVFALGLCSRYPKPSLTLLRQENLLTPFAEQDERCQKMIKEMDAEKMRLFYVAVTRAKQKLYIPLLLEDKQEPLAPGTSSCVELFCNHLLPSEQLLPALEEFSSVHLLQPIPFPCYEQVVPTPVLPRLAPLLDFKKRQIVSFSSLAEKRDISPVLALSDSSIQGMPKGPETGEILHRLFEKILKKDLHRSSTLDSLVAKELADSSLAPWIPEIIPWLYRLFQKPLCGFSLADVPSSQMQYEAEFLYPCSQGVMKGFADLFFFYEGKYYLLDWKSNILVDYSEHRLEQCMKEHQYDLQASIYKEALKRYVKLFDNRPFSSCFGGAIYYFVRGESVYHFFPEDLCLMN